MIPHIIVAITELTAIMPATVYMVSMIIMRLFQFI